MKPFSFRRGRVAKVLGAIVVSSLVAGLSGALAAESGPPASSAPPAGAAPRATVTQPPGEMTREVWRQTLTQTPTPKEGCFTAVYPETSWREAACKAAPNRPYPPKHGLRPQTVGNGVDFSARVSSGLISAATGSFDSVTAGATESGVVGGVGGQVANTFSLQLNTSFFNSTVCAGSPNPACRGWQQFIYSSSNKMAFMQYWLISWGTVCPPGWNTFPIGGVNFCFRNSAAVAVPAAQTAADLHQMTVTGVAGSGGALDSVTLWTNGGAFTATGNDNVVNLAAGWTDAEYNIVGDCCGSQANFSAGTTMVVRTVAHNGTTNQPLCELEGFTGETNNLTLVGTAAIPIQPAPTILFNQSNVAGTVATCAAAQGIGDTHLTTFNGLYYDFQASGDFVLAETGPDFVVQTRQASGAPTWPNAAVNKAVATRMGKTRVAICLAPTRLEVNGKSAILADGKTLGLPGGVQVHRAGNVYVVSGDNGDSVRAELDGSYINVAVGLGHWPAKVRGLLANVDNNANLIATSAGDVLQEPVSFEDLYHRYGDSWRVPADQSMLCKDKAVEHGDPQKLFYAQDLPPAAFKRAHAICTAAGVKEGPHLDACTLDVAVIGKASAAKVFVGAPEPVSVGKPGGYGGGGDGRRGAGQ